MFTILRSLIFKGYRWHTKLLEFWNKTQYIALVKFEAKFDTENKYECTRNVY